PSESLSISTNRSRDHMPGLSGHPLRSPRRRRRRVAGGFDAMTARKGVRRPAWLWLGGLRPERAPEFETGGLPVGLPDGRFSLSDSLLILRQKEKDKRRRDTYVARLDRTVVPARQRSVDPRRQLQR